ncbi:MAG: zf-HC2 domain-containing protein, partial [Candidatus Contendobacter sp.]|nr:zf-HC2 domain-containing protein [Candidatus Contendobacter sp.]
MTSPILKPLTPDACQDIEELLPWYANGALDPAEMAVVEQYLAQHPDRRVELEQCRALAELIEAHDATAWRPAPGAFDRLMTDIDRLEAVSVSAPAQAVPSLWRRALEWLRNTPSPVRWTLAVESLALAALVLVVLSPASLPTDPGYETLSNREAPTVAIGRQMRV